MHFVQPLFLFALASLAIPVIIHLFNFRRYQTEYFTNVQMLEDLRQETHRYSRLRELLILAARLLAIAFLVFAFAQPYIPDPGFKQRKSGQKAVSIYLDNSYSMEATSEKGKLLDVAKARVREILEAYRPSDAIQLLTTNLSGEQLHFTGKEEILKKLSEIIPSPAVKPLSEIISIQTNQLKESRKQVLDGFIISDFQRSTTDLSAIRDDTAVNRFLIPVQCSRVNNLFIDTLYFQSPVHLPGQVSRLVARIRNTGQEYREKIPVKLLINSTQKNIGSLDLAPGATGEIEIPYTENLKGIQYGALQVTDYPIVYDDFFYFSYPILHHIPVMTIDETNRNPFLHFLFTSDSLFTYTNQFVHQLDHNKLLKPSLVILNGLPDIPSGLSQTLTRYLSEGGSIVIFPLNGLIGKGYNSFLTQLGVSTYGSFESARLRVSEIRFESQFFQDIMEKPDKNASRYDLPHVFNHYRFISSRNSGEEVLMTFENGDPFLLWSSSGKGKLYLFSSPLDEKASSFPRHIIFVPVMVRIALESINPGQYYFMAGNNEPIKVQVDSLPNDPIFRLKNLKTGEEIIPQSSIFAGRIRIYPNKQISNPGFYELRTGDKILSGVAFNNDPRESDLTCLSETEIQEMITRFDLKGFHIIRQTKSSLTNEIRIYQQGTPLWKWFVALALFFLFAEIVIIRLAKE